MRSSAPALLPLFRSQLQGELLARVLLTPGRPSISDLARALHAPVATVHREVTRLVEAGVLATDDVGRTRLVRPDETNPALVPLRDLVLVAFGPRHVIADEFAALEGVSTLLIYGSWAARYAGQPGPVPGDVDVLVVGDPDRDELHDAAQRAAVRLSRPVNPTVVSEQRWTSGDQPFLQEVRRRPFLVLEAPADVPCRGAAPAGTPAHPRRRP